MLVVYLANSGSRVLIPDGMDAADNADESLVDFVDETGRVLVTFQRSDVALFEKDDSLGESPLSGAGH